ncbi:16S rRNA m(7)G-527 methyltransferase [Loktanella fryxellensis]|uniref:Ribosomal RNA small subunit methyltransferase G n=1 Tax=Loktanella fryxellensis TaxID=245187 RepID=A0A1H8DW98_9RHOB|nr:16S rRNA (guanine(527)-N(7))-methyltransferase RsmG [Loktanella fryxellensis]SEN11571.1 16S rRNA m(7)G-527 methyltransferase [Loktanella fryxellensis]
MYHDLLLQWTRKINLIAPSTTTDIWDRHIADSAQLFALLPISAKRVVDLGSGGGLPGLVLAIMAKVARPDLSFILIESDQRKAAFLRTVIRRLTLSATVRADRIEAVEHLAADVVTARALAPLPNLLEFASRLMHHDGVALFQKGRSYDDEVVLARRNWAFDLSARPSVTDPDACILDIRNIQRGTHD